MQESYDYKKFAILYVDDEEMSLKSFARAFGDQFQILTAPDAREGYRILEQRHREIAVLMTDQRMPGEKGVWLLEKARQLQPRLIRILVTAYSDMNAAIQAVNSGAVYKYITKPWDPALLELTLKRGLEFFLVQHQRDQLLRERISVLHNMMVTDRMASLGMLSATLSHHIRNALVAVKTFLDMTPEYLLKEKVQPGPVINPEFWTEYHQKVQDQLGNIIRLLRTLDVASKKFATKFQDQVHLRNVVAEVLAKLAQELAAQKIEARNNVPDSMPLITVEGARFSQIFELLLKDKTLTLPPGSKVEITAELVQDDKRPVKIRIRDDGPAPPNEAALFDPLEVWSNRPVEYGFNLIACYFIIHQHGGTIEAESGPDKGTTFTLSLPTDSNAPQPVEASDLFRKIQLVDDLWGKLASQ
jgi:two-component system, probable response regulator PhcQ